MVWEPIPHEHTHILTHTQSHRQTEFYNIRYVALGRDQYLAVHKDETKSFKRLLNIVLDLS